MPNSSTKARYRDLLRFYGFALPYWKLIALSLVAMLAYSAVSFNVVLLINPIVRSFQQENPAAEAARADAEKQAPQEGALGAMERAKERAKEWFVGLPLVSDVVGWLTEDLSLKRVAFILACIIGPLFLISGFAQDYLRGRVVWSVLADVRMAVFDRLTSLSLSYFGGRRTGDLVSRLTNDIAQTAAALKVIFGKLILQPLMLAVFLLAALFFSVELTLVAAVTAPLLVLVMRRYGGRIRRHARKTLQKLADITDSVTQVLGGIRVVKAFHMEEAEKQQFRQRNRQQLKRAFKLVRSEAWANVLPQFLVLALAASAMFLVADYLYNRGRLTEGDMLTCAAALSLVGGRLRRIVKAYNKLQQSMAGVGRLFQLIDEQPQIKDHPNAVRIDGVQEGIEFRNVWFGYEEEPVLKDINLFVPCGQTYAVVGETGAGKSTLLDLIPRFYDPDRGSVAIDGTDVRRIKRSSLMEQIAIVSQHPFLFNRSIAENIRYGDPAATDQEVVGAAAAANVHQFITELPDGYQTMAGEMGDRFSGGQRQCITIARALLKNAPILILDEATSSLDAQSEMLVQRALDNLMVDRTTLVIAHRLSTVRGADKIVVLKDGRIAETGTHAELLERGGEYHRLYSLQFARGDAEVRALQAGAAEPAESTTTQQGEEG